MFITVTWHGNQFNIDLSTKEGGEAFLSVKGCRIASGKNGEFVGYPATKNEQTGKWWSHVYGSEKFSAVVLEKAKAAMPQERQEKRDSFEGFKDDIPF